MEGLQALSELAILLRRLTARRGEAWNAFSNGQSANRWKDFIIGRLSQPRVAQLPRKRPLHSFPYLLPYLSIRQMGFHDDYWEETILRLQAFGMPDAQEVVPFRRLDVAYFMNEAGQSKPNLVSYYRDTFAARMKNDVFIDDDSAYSITHTIIYLSNFGSDSLLLAKEDSDRLERLVESLIVTYWRRGHWDLLGELLFCRAILATHRRSLVSWAYRAFVARQYPDGAIPGRVESEQKVAEARKVHDERTIFSACYHTTLVSVLVAAQILQGYD